MIPKHNEPIIIFAITATNILAINILLNDIFVLKNIMPYIKPVIIACIEYPIKKLNPLVSNKKKPNTSDKKPINSPAIGP